MASGAPPTPSSDPSRPPTPLESRRLPAPERPRSPQRHGPRAATQGPRHSRKARRTPSTTRSWASTSPSRLSAARSRHPLAVGRRRGRARRIGQLGPKGSDRGARHTGRHTGRPLARATPRRSPTTPPAEPAGALRLGTPSDRAAPSLVRARGTARKENEPAGPARGHHRLAPLFSLLLSPRCSSRRIAVSCRRRLPRPTPFRQPGQPIG